MKGHGAGPGAARAPDDFAAPRPRLAIIGAGRAGTVLGRALVDAGYAVTAVHSLNAASAQRLAGRLGASPAPTAVAAVRRSDITLLTVPDHAITPIATAVAAAGAQLRGRALVHCSGARGRSALAPARAAGVAVGACHPLMALATGAEPAELRGSFFGIDADAALLPVLERLVTAIGGIPFAAPEGDRALYHAAAVLAGNAPLALLARAAELLETAGVDAAVAGPALAALLEGAARNARRLGARAALTGPVVRNDAATVAGHLHALRGDQRTQHLYHRLARETLLAVGATGREQVADLLNTPLRAPRAPAAGAAAAANAAGPAPRRARRATAPG